MQRDIFFFFARRIIRSQRGLSATKLGITVLGIAVHTSFKHLYKPLMVINRLSVDMLPIGPDLSPPKHPPEQFVLRWQWWSFLSMMWPETFMMQITLHSDMWDITPLAHFLIPFCSNCTWRPPSLSMGHLDKFLHFFGTQLSLAADPLSISKIQFLRAPSFCPTCNKGFIEPSLLHNHLVWTTFCSFCHNYRPIHWWAASHEWEHTRLKKKHCAQT